LAAGFVPEVQKGPLATTPTVNAQPTTRNETYLAIGIASLKARDNGLSEYADELTQLASEAFDQAADMERRLVSDPKTPLQ
jgi:hypothetical protein